MNLRFVGWEFSDVVVTDMVTDDGSRWKCGDSADGDTHICSALQDNTDRPRGNRSHKLFHTSLKYTYSRSHVCSSNMIYNALLLQVHSVEQ